MSAPTNHPPIEIAPPPVRAPEVDRVAAAERVNAALALSSRVSGHAKVNPRVAMIASGIEAGINDRAYLLADLLKQGAHDEDLVIALNRLEEAVSSGYDVLQRVDYSDHDQRARKSPPESVRLPIKYEAL